MFRGSIPQYLGKIGLTSLLVSQQKVIKRIKVIKEKLVLISKINSILKTFTTAKKIERR